jgi:hypothetical protein
MIDKALEILEKEIQDFIGRLPEFKVNTEKKIHTTSIVKFDGSIAIEDDSLGMSLVNIEEEKVMKSQKTTAVDINGLVSHINPELKINLYLLIAAHFKKYNTGLEFLSGVIRFFQSKSVFTHQNTPALDKAIQKLIVELYTLNFEQQNHLWGALGAKYLPSVMYKIRLLSVQESQKADEEAPIKTAGFSAKGI